LNGLENDWTQDVWCNPPHSNIDPWVRKGYDEHQKNNITVVMLLPANTMGANYWHECVKGKAEVHEQRGRPRFLRDGKISKYPSRNSYVAIIWRSN